MKFNKTIGPTFVAELNATGEPFGVSFFASGEIINWDSLTAAQRTRVTNVMAAHDASKGAPRAYSKRKLFRAMTDTQFATFDTTRGQQSARKRAIFDADDILREDASDYGEFLALMHGKFGEAETKRLLDLSVE